MFQIKPSKDNASDTYITITGGSLKTKFSIHNRTDGFVCTSAFGNSELVSFLDGLSYLGTRKDTPNNYHWWKVEANDVIQLQHDLMEEFEP